ncbi:MAG: AI-2E family transporter [Acetobacteraceae bacterium]|nr:AI-2E family transporter [Acetobacteraceae bacterium]
MPFGRIDAMLTVVRPGASSETNRGQQIARGALGLALAMAAIFTLRSFMPALAWAAIFAIAIWPSYQWAEKRWPPGKHNILLPLLFTLGVALVFILPLALVGVQLGREAHSLFEWVSNVQRDGVPVPAWVHHLPFGAEYVSSWWQDNLADPDDAQELVKRLHQGGMLSFGQHLGFQLVHRAVLFGFTILTLFFLFRDGKTLTEQLRRAGHSTFGPRGERVGLQIIASVHGTVDGLVLVGVGEGILLGIAYYVLDVPHPTLLGALTAVAATIPMGAPLVFGIAALIVLAQSSAAHAIILLAFGFAVVFVADHFIRPVLIGGSTRLPFLWVLLGILGGVETWGLLGLFLGPAIMAALILLWREWTEGAAHEDAPASVPANAASRLHSEAAKPA